MGVRFHLRHYAVAGLATGAVALSGCGTAAAPGGSAPGPAKVALTLTMSTGQGNVLAHRTLRCDAPGGADSGDATTCDALAHLKTTGKATQPFAPVSKHVMCPMIMMSDKRIVVTGTWYGHEVHRVVLDGGCDVALFESMAKILR